MNVSVDISPEVSFLQEVGGVTGDASVTRGLVTAVSVVGAMLVAGRRIRRQRKAEEDRVRVSVDAPKGHRVDVSVGEREEQAE